MGSGLVNPDSGRPLPRQKVTVLETFPSSNPLCPHTRPHVVVPGALYSDALCRLEPPTTPPTVYPAPPPSPTPPYPRILNLGHPPPTFRS